MTVRELIRLLAYEDFDSTVFVPEGAAYVPLEKIRAEKLRHLLAFGTWVEASAGTPAVILRGVK